MGKAIAIARKYLLDEETPIDLLVFPKFEQDIREGSNMIFELKRSNPIAREPSEADLSCKGNSAISRTPSLTTPRRPTCTSPSCHATSRLRRGLHHAPHLAPGGRVALVRGSRSCKASFRLGG